jgi:DNA topoisomerase IB
MVVASLVKYGTLLQYADEAGIDKTTLLSSINDILTEVAGHKITASTLTIVASWDVTNGVKVITHYVPP